MPGSDQLHSGVQTDDRATYLEPHAKNDSAQTKAVPVCNSIFNEILVKIRTVCKVIFKENLTFGYKDSPVDEVNRIKMYFATILEPCA